MFLEAPIIFDPINLSGNLPSSLWEVITFRKVTGEVTNVAKQNKMAARGGLFCLVRTPWSYQRRPFLADMADCEVIERFWLSRARIEWLIKELKEELERNTARSCPLAPETQVNIIVVLFIYRFAWKRYVMMFFFIVFQNQPTAGKKLTLSPPGL